MRSSADLHPYQVYVARRIRETDRVFAQIDLGLGKTISTLTAIVDLLDAFDIRKVLVIAPLRVAKNTWPNEISEWTHTRHLRYAVACGTPAEREAAVATKADIHVINIENLDWLETYLGPRFDYDMIVLDESSMIKNTSTKRFKVMRRLSKRVKRMVLLTATPAPNSLLDLYGQVFVLDGGKRLGPSYHHYKNVNFYPTDYGGYKWALRKGRAEAIHESIRDLTVTLRAEDYLTLPDKVMRVVPVPLNGALDGYKAFEKKLVQELPSGTIEAVTAAALATKLSQYANGQVYDADRKAHAIHDAKIEAALELVEEAQEPVIIVYTFQSDRERLLAALPHAVVLDKNPETITRWNRGEIPVLLCHPASAGHGLNLQHGGRHLIWMGCTYSLELYQQMNARLHRQGQTKPVVVHHLIATGTIDETIMGVLADKSAGQESLLNALKLRLNIS